MQQYRILVTSVGGDLGKAVCKALRLSNYNIHIIGVDCKNYVPYSLFCNEFQVVPKAEGVSYLEFMNRFVLNKSIDLIYPCSEQELLHISDHYNEILPEIQYKIVMPPQHIIEICRDKCKTTEFLRKNHFPYPYSVRYTSEKNLGELVKEFHFPFIAKKVSDCGSKHLHIIENLKDLECMKDLDESYLFQEYLSGKEYTNGVYKDAFSDKTYVITLERTLKDGMSDEVKVIFDKEIENLCVEVASSLKLEGAINIQLRRHEGEKPVIFEINPRYSSTAFMRAKFGFQDVIYAFENMVLKKAIEAPKIREGEAYRYITEYYKFYESFKARSFEIME